MSDRSPRTEGCRLHGRSFTHGCPGCADYYEALEVVQRLRWWRLTNLCSALLGHFYRPLEPGVDRCCVCRTLRFSNVTMTQLERWLLP